ncbi:ATP-binding protein [Vibrio sp. SCSIO 43169]|uniref:ATP-binding protein n=1 Tax=Vibrio sp. SCSIO 43169 TaxID=2822801 RepID=UPI002044C1FC|nr:ATP-binding protein [Vibrio sp. SCSIO 43169]MCM5509791.1 AAA family ATPase [Vibrio sp. SCSIO 43169]
MKKIIFVCGVHGAGKGTLSRALSSNLGIRAYSASDIIKSNSSYVEDSKLVSSSNNNQLALIKGLDKITDDNLLLDGHFCLLGRDSSVLNIEYEVFDVIAPKLIIYVYTEAREIYRRLTERDGEAPNVSTISKLQEREKSRAVQFSQERDIMFVSYSSGDSAENLMKVIRNI